MDKKEQTRLRVQRYRDKKNSVTSKGVTSPSVTRLDLIKQALGSDLVKDIERQGGSEARYERAYRYHQRGKPLGIVHAIVEDRDRLDKVYRSLRDAKQERNVYYGLPYNGISFDIIGEMLEVTR